LAAIRAAEDPAIKLIELHGETTPVRGLPPMIRPPPGLCGARLHGDVAVLGRDRVVRVEPDRAAVMGDGAVIVPSWARMLPRPVSAALSMGSMWSVLVKSALG
jgi:hypothetical protein